MTSSASSTVRKTARSITIISNAKIMYFWQDPDKTSQELQALGTIVRLNVVNQSLERLLTAYNWCSHMKPSLPGLFGVLLEWVNPLVCQWEIYGCFFQRKLVCKICLITVFSISHHNKVRCTFVFISQHFMNLTQMIIFNLTKVYKKKNTSKMHFFKFKGEVHYLQPQTYFPNFECLISLFLNWL